MVNICAADSKSKAQKYCSWRVNLVFKFMQDPLSASQGANHLWVWHDMCPTEKNSCAFAIQNDLYKLTEFTNYWIYENVTFYRNLLQLNIQFVWTNETFLSLVVWVFKGQILSVSFQSFFLTRLALRLKTLKVV